MRATLGNSHQLKASTLLPNRVPVSILTGHSLFSTTRDYIRIIYCEKLTMATMLDSIT